MFFFSFLFLERGGEKRDLSLVFYSDGLLPSCYYRSGLGFALLCVKFIFYYSLSVCWTWTTLQALGFVGCLALDMAPMNREQLPHWYRHLRVPLSIGAAASMLLTAAAYRHTHGMDSGLSVLRPVYLQRPPSVSIFADASKQA